MDLDASCKQRSYLLSLKTESPPRPPCEDCLDAARCVMRGALCRELICNWSEGIAAKGCEFHSPDNYHGLDGVRA